MNNLLTTCNAKRVEKQTDWNLVDKELEAENLKLMSYDQTLLAELGDVTGKQVLDYGCGPGILARALAELGAETKVYDINPEMREKAAEKIGPNNVFGRLEDIPQGQFDIIICNLVLCIVSEEEVKNIVNNIKSLLLATGRAYIGFCNPKIHNVAESQLDFRFFSGKAYQENHSYKKIKKEGVYEIVENHRPVDWYAKTFYDCGLALLDIITTPEYQVRKDKITDFVIFKLQK